MRRILVRVGLAIVALFVLLVGFLFVFLYAMRPRVNPAPAVTAPKDPATVARGEYLANHVVWCVNCHSDVDTTKPTLPDKSALYTGRDYSKEFAALGTLAAPNLTPSTAHGIGGWSDGEVLRAMREGIAKGNRPLFTMMPYEHFGQTLSDADALAIIAYLRSLPANERAVPPTQIKFPFSALLRLAPHPATPPAGAPAPGTTEYEDWLLKMANCTFCHATYDPQHQVIPGHEYAGGAVNTVDGKTFGTPNITSDPATGIGAYSEDDIVRVLDGTSKSGAPIRVMPIAAFHGLTDSDKHAIARAVKRLPPVSHVSSATAP